MNIPEILNHKHTKTKTSYAQWIREAEATTLGERLADKLAGAYGSWACLIVITIILVSWISYNLLAEAPFDMYPFILLNLFLSFIAGYTGTIVLMASNRSGKHDRLIFEHNFAMTNDLMIQSKLLLAEIKDIKKALSEVYKGE